MAVRYERIHHLLERLSRRKRLANRLIKTAESKSLSGFPKSIGRSHERWKHFFENTFLKDAAYDYESEVRICIRLGWDSSLRYEREELEEKGIPLYVGDRELSLKEQSMILKHRLKPVTGLSKEEVPGSYFVATPDEFIESVCIDPRAPKHKADFVEAYFGKLDVAVVKSNSLEAAWRSLARYPDLHD